MNFNTFFENVFSNIILRSDRNFILIKNSGYFYGDFLKEFSKQRYLVNVLNLTNSEIDKFLSIDFNSTLNVFIFYDDNITESIISKVDYIFELDEMYDKKGNLVLGYYLMKVLKDKKDLESHYVVSLESLTKYN